MNSILMVILAAALTSTTGPTTNATASVDFTKDVSLAVVPSTAGPQSVTLLILNESSQVVRVLADPRFMANGLIRVQLFDARGRPVKLAMPWGGDPPQEQPADNEYVPIEPGRTLRVVVHLGHHFRVEPESLYFLKGEVVVFNHDRTQRSVVMAIVPYGLSAELKLGTDVESKDGR